MSTPMTFDALALTLDAEFTTDAAEFAKEMEALFSGSSPSSDSATTDIFSVDFGKLFAPDDSDIPPIPELQRSNSSSSTSSSDCDDEAALAFFEGLGSSASEFTSNLDLDAIFKPLTESTETVCLSAIDAAVPLSAVATVAPTAAKVTTVEIVPIDVTPVKPAARAPAPQLSMPFPPPPPPMFFPQHPLSPMYAPAPPIIPMYTLEAYTRMMQDPAFVQMQMQMQQLQYAQLAAFYGCAPLAPAPPKKQASGRVPNARTSSKRSAPYARR